jgi:hypothetical protein
MLSVTNTAFMTVVSAAVFAVGVCYFWPTMIGAAAEYVPKTGALGMSILGGAGFVATSMILPIMGQSIEVSGPQVTLRNMAVLPLILIVAFIIFKFVAKKEKVN